MRAFSEKKILRSGLIVGLMLGVVMGVYYYVYRDKYPNDRELAKTIFGIDIKDYTVLKKENKLFKEKYDGEYELLLQVKIEKMEKFLSELQEVHFFKCDFKTMEEKNMLENEYQRIQRKIHWEKEQIDSIYWFFDIPRRIIETSDGVPKTVRGFAYIKKCDNGVYEVYLDYLE